MHKFVRNLITGWRRLDLPTDDEPIVVAVSGGADSVAMLCAFADLKQRKKISSRLIAAHFNHGLRGGESDADETFVRELAGNLGVEFATEKGTIKKTGNLEQNARNARYKFLSMVADKNCGSIVVTGHTMNDQAETFLINLIRGSGIDGLSAIPVIRSLDNEKTAEYEIPDPKFQISLIRPLLSWAKRQATEKYCREIGIGYRHDAMNDDLAVRRVQIRKQVIPLLETINPKIVETLASTADLMRASIPSLRIHAVAANELTIATLRQVPEPEAGDQIRSWLIAKLGTSRQLTLKHIRAISRLAFSDKSGRYVELPGGTRVTRSGGKLVYTKNRVEN